jgi:hypothetical protein
MVCKIEPTSCIAILLTLFVIRILFVTRKLNQSCQFRGRLHKPGKIAKQHQFRHRHNKKYDIGHRSKQLIISTDAHHPYFINSFFLLCPQVSQRNGYVWRQQACTLTVHKVTSCSDKIHSPQPLFKKDNDARKS